VPSSWTLFGTLYTPKHFHETLHVLMQVGKYMPLLSSRVENNGQLLLTAQAQPQGDQAWLHIMDNIDNTDKQLHGL